MTWQGKVNFALLKGDHTISLYLLAGKNCFSKGMLYVWWLYAVWFYFLRFIFYLKARVRESPPYGCSLLSGQSGQGWVRPEHELRPGLPRGRRTQALQPPPLLSCSFSRELDQQWRSQDLAAVSVGCWFCNLWVTWMPQCQPQLWFLNEDSSIMAKDSHTFDHKCSQELENSNLG